MSLLQETVTIGFVRASYRFYIYHSLYEAAGLKERAYVDVYRSFESRYDSLLGLALIKHLSERDIVLDHDIKGKPYVKESSEDVSITHSSGITAAVLSPGRIGIDLEEIVKKTDEARLLAAMGFTAPSPFSFTVLWTRAEAYSKMLGCGFKSDPFPLFQEAASSTSRWHFHTDTVAENVVLAVCSEKPFSFQLQEVFEDTLLQSR